MHTANGDRELWKGLEESSTRTRFALDITLAPREGWSEIAMAQLSGPKAWASSPLQRREEACRVSPCSPDVHRERQMEVGS